MIQLRRPRVSAGVSFRTSGSRAMLQASAINAAHTLVGRSGIRERVSLTWVKASANPVHAFTSSSSSGRSTCGSIRSVSVRSSTRLGGSSSPSSPVRTSFSRPPATSIRTAAFCRQRSAVRRYASSSSRPDVLEEWLRRRRQSQHPTTSRCALCPMSRALAAAREGRPTGCSWRRRHPGAAMRCEAVLERRT